VSSRPAPIDPARASGAHDTLIRARVRPIGVRLTDQRIGLDAFGLGRRPRDRRTLNYCKSPPVRWRASFFVVRNLRAAGLLLMAAAEPGNWQSHIKPLGVVPGWLFYFARPWGLSHATREDRPGFSALSSRYGRSAKLPRMRKADDGGDARSKD